MFIGRLFAAFLAALNRQKARDFPGWLAVDTLFEMEVINWLGS